MKIICMFFEFASPSEPGPALFALYWIVPFKKFIGLWIIN